MLLLGAALLAGVGWATVRSFAEVRNSSRLKAMIPRQPAAGIDQFFLETDRIFLSYGELIGPKAYIKSYNPVDGEDLSVQFPLRRHWSNELPVRLPDGSTVRRYEVIAAIGRSGLIATYPLPQEGAYDPKRVYRLDCGVSYRGTRVVNRPPDPAGREGRDQDGVHIYQLPDGRRFEITYRGGVPDGPFRAFYADGRPWGEATYRQGRVIEAWLFTRQGRRMDELKDGPAASDALIAEAKVEAAEHAGRARRKMATRDFQGAETDFTAAIDRYGNRASYLDRAEARLALGNIDGAIADCQHAMYSEGTDAEYRVAEQKLKDLQQRRAKR